MVDFEPKILPKSDQINCDKSFTLAVFENQFLIDVTRLCDIIYVSELFIFSKQCFSKNKKKGN